MSRLNTLFAFILINICLTAQVNLTSSLTACYELDGNASEPVNNLTGTLSSVSPTLGHLSTVNTGMHFNGQTTSFIRLPNTPLLKPNQITVSAWIKTDNLATQTIVFTKNSFSSYFCAYVVNIVNMGAVYKFELGRQNGSASDLMYSTTNVAVNTWYHIAFCMDNTAMQLYVNGILENTMTPGITNFNYDPSRDVILGGTNESYNDPFIGTLDNARFYNRVLNANEINALYVNDPTCNPLPNPSFSVFPTNACVGGTVALTDLSTNTPTAWVWQTPGAATNSSSINNPVITFPGAGIFTISLSSSNAAGQGNIATQTIQVMPVPVLNIISNSVICAGQSATLNATGANSYVWNTAQTGPSIVIVPSQTTTYSVIGMGVSGCTNSAQYNVTVSNLSLSGTTVICEGESTSLLLGGTPATYTWSTGSNANLITVSPSVSTIYTATGTAVNGCICSVAQVVQVNTMPVVTANANNNPLCSGDALILSGGGAATYTWTGGVINNTAFYPTIMTNYTVTGTGTNSCKGLATIQVMLNPKPGVLISSSASSITCPGQVITFSASGANTYSWSTGNITPDITIAPTITSSYTVTGTDPNGCKGVNILTQTVNECTGIKNNLSADHIKVYPNPTNAKVSIEMSGNEIIPYRIINVFGTILFSGDVYGETSIDLSSCTNGIYFLQLKSKEAYRTIKIVKE